MQRRSIAALMISLLLLSACGHGAGERSFQTFRDTLTGSLVTCAEERARSPSMTSCCRRAISTPLD